jgi:hypothetical protein
MVIFSPMITVTTERSAIDWQTMALLLVFADRLTVLMVSDAAIVEKNWAFLSMNETHIDMVRGFFPLRVVSCDIDSGVCVNRYENISSQNIGPVRGGTQMVEIRPNVFAGWVRTHLDHCCCSERFYRSHLAIIRRIKGNHFLTAISGPFDFEVSGVERQRSPKCEGRDIYMNAIIPAAITAFDENAMTVLFYRQDRDRILVRVCGIVEWIIQLADGMFDAAGEDKAGRCAIEATHHLCQTYPR